MQLKIDGVYTEPKADETLAQLVQQLGLGQKSLAERPLAAKIAGEVFTLNYVPVRQKDVLQERSSMRRAMEASGGEVSLLRYGDDAGKDVYIRTAQFVIFLAISQLWPQARAMMSCTLGSSVFISVTGEANFDVERLKERVAELIKQDIPLIRRRVPLQQAIDRFRENGQEDKARLLSWRKADYFDEYAYGSFSDYYYGEMAPSTGYLTVYRILPAPGVFLFVYPDDQNPDTTAPVPEMPHFFSVFSEGQRWCELMECATAADLNELTESGKIRELIRVNEALHEKRFSQVADMVCQREAKVVMLAGPSSSGKTTSANRLATQLRVHGKKPILMSLDDYYIDRDKIPAGPDGKLDLEHINTIDTALFRQQVEQLLAEKSEGKTLAFVGDGINDAPALTRADLGIAIGAGTDVAIDAADVVLMNSRLSDVPAAIRLSRATLRNIHENLFWAFFYNTIGIPLAAGVWIPIFGWTLQPMFGALAMSLSSFCVVTNALRLNLFRLHEAKHDKHRQPVTLPDEFTAAPQGSVRAFEAFHGHHHALFDHDALADVKPAERFGDGPAVVDFRNLLG